MASNNGNGQATDPQHRPATFLKAFEASANKISLGQANPERNKMEWILPNWGAYPVSHVTSFQSLMTSAARVYRQYDEALKHSLDNARYMRNDCGIMECLEARQRCVSLLNWHLEPEDDKSHDQKELCAELTKVLKRIRRFVEYQNNLLHATWFGKYAIQHTYGWQNIGGKMRLMPAGEREGDIGWSPIHGDKLCFRFDDGTLIEDQYDGQVGIRVGTSYVSAKLLKEKRQIETTDRGMAYFLTEDERRLLAIHKHMIEDGEYEDAISAGKIHGVGIRSRIYWEWVQKQETLAFLMEYLERCAGGIQLWHFPAGNTNAKREVEQAVAKFEGGSRNVILVPIPAGDDGHQYGVQVMEPGMAGIDMLKDLVDRHFGHRIKRYILGQVLSSEAEATGLGSGVAEAHMDTLHQIIKYDATNLEETITFELLANIKNWNFPAARNIHVRFVKDTETDDAKEKLEGFQIAYQMGAKIREKDVMELVGAAIPGQGDAVLSLQAQQEQQAQQQQQMMQQQGGIGSGGVHGIGMPGQEGNDEGEFGEDFPSDEPPPGPLGPPVGPPPDRGGQAEHYAAFKESDHPRGPDGQFVEHLRQSHRQHRNRVRNSISFEVSRQLSEATAANQGFRDALRKYVKAGDIAQQMEDAGYEYPSSNAVKAFVHDALKENWGYGEFDRSIKPGKIEPNQRFDQVLKEHKGGWKRIVATETQKEVNQQLKAAGIPRKLGRGIGLEIAKAISDPDEAHGEMLDRLQTIIDEWNELHDDDPERYARKPAKGQSKLFNPNAQGEFEWVTIGGHPEGDKQHAGGTPVQIKKSTGEIAKGPDEIEGKTIDELKGGEGEGDRGEDRGEAPKPKKKLHQLFDEHFEAARQPEKTAAEPETKAGPDVQHLLDASEPFSTYGDNYRRDIGASRNRLLQAMDKGHSGPMIEHLAGELEMRLDAHAEGWRDGATESAEDQTKTRGKYQWRLNKSDKWAWFEGDKQTTGAYPNESDADYAFDAHRLKDDAPDEPAPTASFKEHPEYERLNRTYGSLSKQQIDDQIDRMAAEIKNHQHVARREFNGNGGRRTGAAVSAEAARELGNEKLLLGIYRDDKFGATEASGVPEEESSAEVAPERSESAPDEEPAGWKPENHVLIAADSIEQLRGQDVYRLLESAPPQYAQSMANWIREKRPDLSGDVHDAQVDLADETGQPSAQETPQAPKPGSALTGMHKEAFDQVSATMTRQVGNELSARRKAMVARNLIHGEPPAVQKALGDHLKQLDPEAWEHLKNNQGLGIADAFKETPHTAQVAETNPETKQQELTEAVPQDTEQRDATHNEDDTSDDSSVPLSVPQRAERPPVEGPHTLERHGDIVKRLRSGDMTPEEWGQHWENFKKSVPAIREELSKRTMKQLAPRGAGGKKKSEVVDSIIDNMASRFTAGEGYSFSPPFGAGREAWEQAKHEAIDAVVKKLTPEHFKTIAERHAADKADYEQQKAAHEKAIADPQTLEDFKTLVAEKGEAGLTPEQAEKYDDLQAEARRAKDREKKATVQGFEGGEQKTGGIGIVKGHHQKRNQPTHTVTVENRLGSEGFQEALRRAKQLGGSYVNAMIAKRYGATAGFQFFDENAANKFADVLRGETADRSEDVEQREADRQANRAESLSERAETLGQRAEESLGQNRLTNTARRADMAASANARARGQQADAKTLGAIAQKMQSGELKHLNGVKAMTHMDTLNRALRLGQYKRFQEQSKQSGSTRYEDFMQQPHGAEDVAAAEYPYPSLRQSDLKDMAQQFSDVPGLKQIAASFAKAGDNTPKFQGSAGGYKTSGGHIINPETFADEAGQKLRGIPEGKHIRVHASRSWDLMKRAGITGGRTHLYTADKGKTWGKTPESAVIGAYNKGHELDFVDAPQDERLTIRNPDYIEKLATAARRLRRSANSNHRRIGERLADELTHYNRLQAADIKSPAELRAALREYLPLKSGVEKEDPVKAKERALIGQKIPGFFPTPRPLIDRMLDAAGIEPGHDVLEPSAGKGDILDAIRERHPEAQTTGVEPHSSLRDILGAKGHNLAEASDFLQHQGQHDRIVMNPPFENGQDMAHVRHAFEQLKPGGRLVAVMSQGPFYRGDKKSQEFRDWLDSVGGEHEDLPEGSFAGTDAFRQTGVNTRLVTITKPSA